MQPNTANNTFLNDVRQFLSNALTNDLRAAGPQTVGVHSDIGACRIWHRRLFERGWIAPAWPLAYGGAGWSPVQRLLFERECAANDAPVLFAGGLRSLGPLLIEMGTPAQRMRYLPAILDGRELWCQGFSEPGAGSDLAALMMRAEPNGDHYVVNGSKIWTTGALLADRMFCLVRTTKGPKLQEGITFLLVDMTLPGITVRPIQTLSGEAEFNEVHFDSVRVPVSDRVGEEGRGWTVAKTLMRVARSNNTTSGLLRRVLRRAQAIVIEPGYVRERVGLTALSCRLDAFEAMELALLTRAGANGISDVHASTLKIAATELHQDIATLMLEGAGDAALPIQAFESAKYFATRAASIYSGTNETHRNLIAHRGLGL